MGFFPSILLLLHRPPSQAKSRGTLSLLNTKQTIPLEHPSPLPSTCAFQKKFKPREFPTGWVVRIWHSLLQPGFSHDLGTDPRSGNWDPTSSCCNSRQKKKKIPPIAASIYLLPLFQPIPNYQYSLLLWIFFTSMLSVTFTASVLLVTISQCKFPPLTSYFSSSPCFCSVSFKMPLKCCCSLKLYPQLKHTILSLSVF